MTWHDQWARRRNETLTYYPDVARVGNLPDALTGALAEIGSSLNASSPVPPGEPAWSPFIDHPDAPGRTVPEFARVRHKNQVCQVVIASFKFALGAFGLTFFLGEARDQVGLGKKVGTIITNDLATTAAVVRDAMDHGTELSELAQASGTIFRPPPRPASNPAMQASVDRMLANVFEKLDRADPQDQERAQRVTEALKRRYDSD